MRNAIDGRLYTYWLYPVLLDSAMVDGPRIKVKLDLGGTREINVLTIEPVPSKPMELEQLIYVATDGSTNTISIDATIEKETNIYFSSILAAEITLVFRQPHGEPAMYYHKTGTNLWEAINLDTIQTDESDADRLNRISDELQDLVTDDTLKDICNIPERPGWEVVRGVQYTFGFDNILFGNRRYASRGIFVSKILEVDKVGLLGLRAKEINPTVRIGNEDYNIFSFEYYISKQNYDENGLFIDSELIPILPIETGATVQNERLWLRDISLPSAIPNVVYMRFTPDMGSGNPEPVVRKNLANELTIGTDYTVYVEGSTSPGWRSTWAEVWDDISNQATEADQLLVKIRFEEPSVVSFYTVDYIAYRGRQLLDYVKLQRNGVVACNASHVNKSLAKSRLYLVIIMRRNYVTDTETAAVEEYKLLVASHDPAKYS